MDDLLAGQDQTEDKELDRMEHRPEVFLDENAPFERPAKDFVEGPFYKAIEEKMPELSEDEEGGDEPPALAVDRRDFLRLFSASALLGATASCVRRPEEKIRPQVNMPIDSIVGVPKYYATTCGECSSGCGVVVKTKGGRPVKIEGNVDHDLSQGASCALGQSTLQALYHPERGTNPLIRRGSRVDSATWEEAYQVAASRIKEASNVAVLTKSLSGNAVTFYEDFLKQIGSSAKRLYQIESNPYVSALSTAYESVTGVRATPKYKLDEAKFILGIGTDFLDLGSAVTFYSKSFSRTHRVKDGSMAKFVQFEPSLTLTGAAADERHVIPVGGEIFVALKILDLLSLDARSKFTASEKEAVRSLIKQSPEFARGVAALRLEDAVFSEILTQLFAAPSVVLCGNSAVDANTGALLVAGLLINRGIGAFGATISDESESLHGGTDDTMRLIQDLGRGDIDLLIVVEANPLFTISPAFGFSEQIKKLKHVFSIQSFPNETDEVASVCLPAHHYLESWGDSEPVKGLWSVRQPVVRPMFNSRQAEDSLLWMAASLDKPMGQREYREYLMQKWQSIHQQTGATVPFELFWKGVLKRGFVKVKPRVSRGGFSITPVVSKLKIQPINEGPVLHAPLDYRLHDGSGANRPVLQEIGDSLTTITWDSWLALSPQTCMKMGFRRNDVIRVENKLTGASLEVALYPMPGLHSDAVVIYRGNGHKSGSKVWKDVGVNPLEVCPGDVDAFTSQPVTSGIPVNLVKTGRRYHLASMQKHNDIANRSDIIKKITVSDYIAKQNKTKDLDKVPDLYPPLPSDQEYRWGMSIDLNACTGCSACMVACATENNVPQVGREQVRKGREMHWIRLDRYFSGPAENPEVNFQPVMCQHCNHAPCEAVCPVFATVHHPEGMNSQIYNRCVGTRYCGNACPYKVRRFNWFTHKWNQIGPEGHQNPRATNPDVTVRTRGVMEKCTFCAQRIREAKHEAKNRGDTVRDGDLKTACQQACPTQAITFGNLKDESSEVARLRKSYRSFLMLNADPEHGHYGIKTLPNVNYLADLTHKSSGVSEHANNDSMSGV